MDEREQFQARFTMNAEGDWVDRVALDLEDYDPFYDDPEVETLEDRW